MSLDRSKIRSGSVIVFFAVVAALCLLIDSKKWVGPDGMDLKEMLLSWVSLGIWAFSAFWVNRFLKVLDE